jgi:hypothetical protein
MTLPNKNWLKNQVLRRSLSGESQDSTAGELKVTVGTVNNIIDEILKSDDTAALQPQIAIVAKKEKVSINQIAANLRYKNLIKLSMLDEKKSEKFLNTLEKMFNKYSVPPTAAANLIFSAIEILLKENVEPDKLEEAVKSKFSQLRDDEKRVDANKKEVHETQAKLEQKQKALGIKENDLNAFHNVSIMLKLYRYPEISSEYGMVARALIDMKKMGYDAKVIVSNYDRLESLTEANKKLDKRLRESENQLQYYSQKLKLKKALWKDYDKAFNNFNRLVQNGLKEEDIFSVADILKNDFPQHAIEELRTSIRVYGNIAATLSRIKRDYEEKTGESFEETEQNIL